MGCTADAEHDCEAPETDDANEVVTGGDADLVFIGRELLRKPYWARKTQRVLGREPSWPTPYGYAARRRAQRRVANAWRLGFNLRGWPAVRLTVSGMRTVDRRRPEELRGEPDGIVVE